MVQLVAWGLLALSLSRDLYPQRRTELEKCLYTLDAKRSDMESSSRCEICFMTLPFCICGRIQAIDCSGVEIPDIICYTHYKEFSKTSNTGKLVPKLFPRASQIVYFRGEEDDICETCSDIETLVVYPSKDSIPLHEYLALRNGLSVDKRHRLVLLDSTWSQSKSLNRNLNNGYIRVNLNAQALSAGPSLFLNRRQVSLNRTSTLETLILTLQEMGVTKQVTDLMYEALKISVTSVLKQNGLYKQHK